MENLMKLMEAENETNKEGDCYCRNPLLQLMKKETSKKLPLMMLKTKPRLFVAQKMHEANLTLKQLFFLGLDDKDTLVNKGFCSRC